MAVRYSTAANVKMRTGIQPTDLGLDTDAQLDAFLDELLDEVTELMDRRMRYSYLDADPAPPAGLAGIAADIAADSVREMVVTRQTPVVRVDDFAVRTISSRIFSADVEKRLRLYTRAAAGEIDVGLGYFGGEIAADPDTALFLVEG